MFRSLILGAAIASLGGWAIQPALARIGDGDAFVTTMYDNTMAGRDSRGDRVHLYFLPGGVVSYQLAHRRSGEGSWTFDAAGNLCVKWNAAEAPRSGCYRVNVADNSMTFTEKGEVVYRGALVGGVKPMTMNAKPD